MTANASSGQMMDQARTIKALTAERDHYKRESELAGIMLGTIVSGLGLAENAKRGGGTSVQAVLGLVTGLKAEVERLTRLAGLQRVALDVWKKAHPYESCPMPEPEDITEQKAISFLHQRGRIGWTNWVEELMALLLAAEADVKALAEALEKWKVRLAFVGHPNEPADWSAVIRLTDASLARLDAVRGKEPDNADRPA